MLLKLFSLLIFQASIHAGYVESMQCEPRTLGGHDCKIRIGGKIEPGEKLFLPYAQDSDQLKFENWILGETGFLLRYPYAASQFPRVYSLQPLAGKESVDLLLTTNSFFPYTARPPAKVRVIDEKFSLRKVYLPLVAKTLAFFALIFLSVYLLRRIRRQTIDGWIYPMEELRICFGSLVVFFFLRSEWTHVGVPSLWSASIHYFALKMSMAITIWAASSLIYQARFFDRSCTEKIYSKPLSNFFVMGLDASLLVTLFLILPPLSLNAELALLPVMACGFFLTLAVTKKLEWRRILKRSAKSPLFFHLCLIIFLSFSFLGTSLANVTPVSAEKLFSFLSALLFIAALWRAKRFQYAKQKAMELTEECKELLSHRTSGISRIFAICEFLEDEFGAARVSVLSIHQGKGLLLASAGPDAIPVSSNSQSRKLGPFLKRVCRERHMLYAPVAEELEKELKEQGMKHSSLAFPFQQNSKVDAVLCMMADEGERIPAIEVSVLEMFLKEMELEILSCISQQVAEEKCERLLALARESNALAVEHLDTWGYLNYEEEGEKRFLLGMKILKPGHTSLSPLFEKVFKDFQKEVYLQWQSISVGFEFVIKESRQDFWIFSPTQFQSSYLQKLGVENSTLLLASVLEKTFRNTIAKPCYSLLGFCEFQIALGETNIRFQSHFSNQKNSVEVDSEDFHFMQLVRDQSKSEVLVARYPTQGTAALCDDLKITTTLYTCELSQIRKIDRLLSVSSNKKELRKLEIKSLEILRERKKAA